MNVCLDCGYESCWSTCSRCGGDYCVAAGENPKRQYERANSGTLPVLPSEAEDTEKGVGAS